MLISKWLAQFEDIHRMEAGGAVVKNLSTSAGDARDADLIPELGRSPGERNGNPLQYSCLENSMDRGAWQGIAYGVTKIQTQLSKWACVMEYYAGIFF